MCNCKLTALAYVRTIRSKKGKKLIGSLYIEEMMLYVPLRIKPSNLRALFQLRRVQDESLVLPADDTQATCEDVLLYQATPIPAADSKAIRQFKSAFKQAYLEYQEALANNDEGAIPQKAETLRKYRIYYKKTFNKDKRLKNLDSQATKDYRAVHHAIEEVLDIAFEERPLMWCYLKSHVHIGKECWFVEDEEEAF